MSVPEKIRFCSIKELEKEKSITKWVDEWGDEVSAIFIKEDNDIKVVSTVCPHFGGEIKLVQNPSRLRCKWHGWYFDLNTGKCLSSIMKACLRQYSFQKKDGFLDVIFS